MTTFLRAFVMGYASTMIFHQGLIAILHANGFIPRVPFSLAPTAPFQIPQVISLAFWGGVWGIPLWLVIRRMKTSKYWITALIFGALLPSFVAWFVVSPLKGLPVAGGWKPANMMMSLLLNGAWGIGVALLMKIFGVKR
jgi:hypothetical protein